MRFGARAGDALARGLVACKRALWGAEKVVTGFVEEAAPTLLDAEGRRAFTNRVWERAGVAAGTDPLFAWEENWLTRDLPPPPARVLVGGAGRGREARWLAGAGYAVTAFEPVAEFLPDLREAGARVAEAISYEDLCDGRDRAIRQAAPYDAFLLGWSSFSCIEEPTARAAILRVGAELVPAGPILLSFLRLPRGSGRARRIGRALARRLGLGEGNHARTDRLYAHLGFIHSIGDEELRALARDAGLTIKTLSVPDFEYPHATLVPGVPR
jgi:hypothetical protein